MYDKILVFLAVLVAVWALLTQHPVPRAQVGPAATKASIIPHCEMDEHGWVCK